MWKHFQHIRKNYSDNGALNAFLLRGFIIITSAGEEQPSDKPPSANASICKKYPP